MYERRFDRVLTFLQMCSMPLVCMPVLIIIGRDTPMIDVPMLMLPFMEPGAHGCTPVCRGSGRGCECYNQ